MKAKLRSCVASTAHLGSVVLLCVISKDHMSSDLNSAHVCVWVCV